MAKLNSMMLFQRGTTSEINKLEILDGQVLFDTEKKQILVDEENKRSVYAGKENLDFSEITTSEFTETGFVQSNGGTESIVIPNSNLISAIKVILKKIVKLSERLFSVEKNSIKKENLTFTVSGNDLYITKTY